MTPTYEAEVRLLTGPLSGDFDTVRASSQLAQTYGELATSRRTLDAVRRQLRLRESLDDLVASVNATGNEITRIVTVRARSDDAGRAARIANTIASQLASATSQSANAEAPAPPVGQLTVVDPASPPSAPVEPRVPLITVLGAIAGLIGAAVLVLLLQSGRDTIESEDDVADLGIPLLGAVPLPRGSRARPTALVIQTRPYSRAANEYRVVAAKIELFAESSGARSVLVAGSGNGDGSGLVAANIAAALAEGGTHVTLVDANSVEAEITNVLGLNGQPGYGNLIRSGVPADVGPNPIELTATNSNLAILASGTERGAGPLETDPVIRLLDRLLGRSDLVVVNTPAVEASANTLIWARATDATVVVAQQGRSKREDLHDAVKTLSLVEANVIGTVLTVNRPLWRLPTRERAVPVQGRSTIRDSSAGDLARVSARRSADEH